jgi:23S rRNA-/tRNA-specific pseudouridylate synthase
MSLFVLCFNSPLNALEKNLMGVRIGRSGAKTMVIAYADDVTIVISKPEDIPIVRDRIKIYEEATGAKINIQNRRQLLWDHGTHP